MLKSGILLFFVSSIGVTLRFMEFDHFTGPMVKLVCMLTLMGSISCLLGTYCVTEYARARPIRK